MACLPDWTSRNLFNVGPSIEWYVEMLKQEDREDVEQDSPAFVLQDVEVFLRLLTSGASYVMQLLRNSERSSSVSGYVKMRPFSVSITTDVMDDTVGKFKVRHHYVKAVPDINIWQSICDDPVRPNMKISNPSLRLLRFIITFDKGSGLESEDVRTTVTLDDHSTLQNSLERLSGDLSKILYTSAHTDVQIECGEEVFQAHRAILASRSKGFNRMFRPGTIESRTGIVQMVDADISAVKLFLEFLYSGKIGNPSVDKVYSLFRLADKYDVPTLKNLCFDVMSRRECKRSRK